MPIVQRNYSPFMRPGVPGMIVDMTEASITTRICETAAGIAFGVAVSQGVNDKGAVVGGSGFLGVSVRDITRDGTVIDPAATVRIAADLYPQYANMGVMTRGRIWVTAQGNVAAGAAAYFDGTTGLIASSNSGAAARGFITFTRNPSPDETITINGTAVTFKTSGATGSQVNLRANLGDTLSALSDFLNANVAADAGIGALRYSAYPLPPAGPAAGANQLLIADKTVGTGGNAITLATTVAGATLSGGTLSGGTAAATLINGGRFVNSVIAGGLAMLSLSLQM